LISNNLLTNCAPKLQLTTCIINPPVPNGTFGRVARSLPTSTNDCSLRWHTLKPPL